jgi:two-component system NtrC family sensor kinase
MRLRSRVTALIVILFAVLAMAQVLVQQRILLPRFAMLERQSAKTGMARIIHAIHRELDLLDISALNWGNWTDTYRYMQDRNPEYVARNLYPAAIISMKIDALALIGTDGKYVFAAAYRPITNEPMDIDFITRGGLPADHPWRAALRNGTSVVGLIGTNQGAMLAALSPVLDGNGRGESRGAVLIGRLLTEAEIARIGEQAQTTLTMTTMQPAQFSTSTALPAGAVVDGADTLVELPTVTNVYRTLDDVYGRPLIQLHSEIPRAISAGGRKTVAYAAVFLIVTGATVLIVLLVELNRTVLSPLSRITRHAELIGKRDDTRVRLDLGRADELGTLAREFDRMMDRLVAARRQLVDRSFESGVAEMASGTLHNIGNAITPLAVHVAALRDRLCAAPTADAHLVAAELNLTADDPSRQAELVQFLRLTSLELAEIVSGAEAEAATIVRQAEAVQAAIVQQRDFARLGALVESVSMVELLESAVELVPEALRRHLSLEVDDSVRAVGALCLARTTLQQVLQNLIVNAAEAIRETGRDRGVLSVTAELLPGPGCEQLHLRFQDQGIGITKENLKRIFERGFSTKPRETNSGIGLHWCANALNALGGTIDASSPGPGHGACMHVVVPANRQEMPLMTQVA